MTASAPLPPCPPAFLAGYLRAAEWTDCGPDNDADSPGISEAPWSPEALSQATAGCATFWASQGALLDSTGASFQSLGHDFWLARNGHGAGFWDRGYGPTGDALSEAAHAAGPRDVELGDDGQLYFLPGVPSQ